MQFLCKQEIKERLLLKTSKFKYIIPRNIKHQLKKNIPSRNMHGTKKGFGSYATQTDSFTQAVF